MSYSSEQIYTLIVGEHEARGRDYEEACKLARRSLDAANEKVVKLYLPGGDEMMIRKLAMNSHMFDEPRYEVQITSGVHHMMPQLYTETNKKEPETSKLLLLCCQQ